MTEFALVLPILALLLFGVIQFGIVFNNYITLTDAVRAGARKAAVGRHLPIPERGHRQAVRNAATDLKQSDLNVNVTVKPELDAGLRGNRHGQLPLPRSACSGSSSVRSNAQHDEGACGMSSHRNQRGQAMVLTLVFFAVLLGMAAAVIDVGAWYQRPPPGSGHRRRRRRSPARPRFPRARRGLRARALDYAGRNGGGVERLRRDLLEHERPPNDTIQVTAQKPVPGLVRESLRPRLGYRAPDREGTVRRPQRGQVGGADRRRRPCTRQLQCEPLPCFNQPTTLELDKVGPGAFHIINIDGTQGGIEPEHPRRLDQRPASTPICRSTGTSRTPARSSTHRTSRKPSTPGSATSSSSPSTAVSRGQGSGFEYEVIGWVGWHLTGYQIGGKRKAPRLVHPSHLGRNPEQNRHRRRLRRARCFARRIDQSTNREKELVQ